MDYFFDSSTTHKLRIYNVNVKVTLKNYKQKCPSGFDESHLPNHGMSMVYEDRKSTYILTKNLYGVESGVRSQTWREWSSKRVVKASRSDWSNQSVMRNTFQKNVETEGKK